MSRALPLALALLALAPAAAFAQDDSPPAAPAEATPNVRDISSIRSAGMGDATRGFASSGEAIALNPAGISGTTRFNIDAMAVFEPGHDYRVLAVNAVDSKLNADESFPLAAGVGYYHYTSGVDDARRTGSLVALSLALPLYPEMVFFGATGKYLNLNGAVTSSAITTDLALMVRPIPKLGISAVAYNLIDIKNVEAARSYGGGIAYGSDSDFHLDVDVRVDPRPSDGKSAASIHAGGEVLLGDMFIPRIGYIEDRLRETRYLTGGVSVLFPPIAIEAMYRHELGIPSSFVDRPGRGFGISVRLTDLP